MTSQSSQLTTNRAATPFESQDHRIVRRGLFYLSQVTEQDRKDLLTQGLKDAVTIAGAVIGKNGQAGMDSHKHKEKLENWFGDKNSDGAAKAKIRKVYENFYGDNADGTGADTLSKVQVRNDDYWNPPAPSGDGNTPFCAIEQDGKSGTAYTKPLNGVPSMHFCDKAYQSTKKLSDLTANNCSSLGSVMNTARMGKPFLGFAVLREYM